MGKRKNRRKKAASSGLQSRIVSFPSGVAIEEQSAGVYWRSYPPKDARDRLIAEIAALPSSERTPDQWWMLGEYQVFDGILSEDDAAINRGVDALKAGAELEAPSTACLLDLAWILSHKGLNSLALPYAQQARSIAPDSRDVLVMNAIAEIGVGKVEAAQGTLIHLCSLSSAKDRDHALLDSLVSGGDPSELRRRLFFQKIGMDDPEIAYYPPREQALVMTHVLKPLYEESPGDPNITYQLAYARYVAGQHDKAKPLLQALVADNVGHADAWTLLSLIAKQGGDLATEMHCYSEALEANPDHVLALTNSSDRLIEIGQHHIARQRAARAVEMADPANPYLPDALVNLANTYAYIERDHQTEADLLRRAVSLRSDAPLLRHNLVVACLSAGRFIDARKAWREARERFPKDSLPLDFTRMIDVACDNAADPVSCIILLQEARDPFGWQGSQLLVKKAWDRRRVLPAELREEFLQDLGMIAGEVGAHDVAARIWGELAEIHGNELANINRAVSLADCGRVSDALDLIESMARKGISVERFNTVLGNIRVRAGLNAPAVQAYLKAVRDEPEFALPFEKAFVAMEDLRDPSLAEPFIEVLDSKWGDTPEATMLRGWAHLVAMRPAKAADFFSSVIVNESGGVLDPVGLRQLTGKGEDPTVFDELSSEYHYRFGYALLRSNRRVALEKLVGAISRMPGWYNGDWRVLHAESQRRADPLAHLEDVLLGTAGEVPGMATRGLQAIDQRDFELAEELAKEILNHPSPDGFTHPEGRLSALANAILSLVEHERGDEVGAASYGQQAVAIDPASVPARHAWIKALVDVGDGEKVVAVLEDGLRRLPGDPRLLRLAVEALVEIRKTEEADRLLKHYRPFLDHWDAADVGFRLGERVATERIISAGEVKPTTGKEWPWVDAFPEPIATWLRNAATVSAPDGMHYSVAYPVYLGKVAEHILVERVMRPFKASCENAGIAHDDRFRDVSQFVTSNGRAPSIGGIARILRAAAGPFRSNDPLIVRRFRDFLREAFRNSEFKLGDSQIVDPLGKLAGVRNSAAHIDEPSVDDVRQAVSLIVDGEKPGALLKLLEPRAISAESMS